MSRTFSHMPSKHSLPARTTNQSGPGLRGSAWVRANNRSGAFLAGFNDHIANLPFSAAYETMTFDDQRRYERGRLTAVAIGASKSLTHLTLTTYNLATACARDTVAFGK